MIVMECFDRIASDEIEDIDRRVPIIIVWPHAARGVAAAARPGPRGRSAIVQWDVVFVLLLCSA